MTRFSYNPRYASGIRSIFRYLNNKFLLALFSITLLLSSCEKGILPIGNDLLPGGDMVNLKGTDTLSTISYLMYDEKFRTDNPSISFLGQEFDPYFGTTTAEFVSQIRMSEEWQDSTFVMDSVVLYLHLLSVKGNTNTDAIHNIRLTEITKQIYTDKEYYSNEVVPVGGYTLTVPLGHLRADTINKVDIKLPNAFGEYIIRKPDSLFYSNKISDFRSYFKGLYFQLEQTSDPLMVSLSIAPPAVSGDFYNAIGLFMHTPEAPKAQHIYYFILDATNRNAGYNRILHDFTTATLGDKMIHRNTTYRDTLSYLQGLNGVYTKISLPGLAVLKNDPAFDNIGVNKAKLTVPVRFVPDANHKYISTSLPASLQLRYNVKGEAKYAVPDYNIGTSHSFFDGVLDSVNKVYNFNIPAFVQAYLENTDDYVNPEVEIYQAIGTRNVVFEANKSKRPVKFQFSYTKF